MPQAVALHDTVAVPDPVTVLGLIELHDSPEEIVSLRATTPEKPLRDAMVMFDPIIWPALVGEGVVAVIVKSGNGTTLTATVVLWAKLPPVPVNVTV